MRMLVAAAHYLAFGFEYLHMLEPILQVQQLINPQIDYVHHAGLVQFGQRQIMSRMEADHFTSALNRSCSEKVEILFIQIIV